MGLVFDMIARHCWDIQMDTCHWQKEAKAGKLKLLMERGRVGASDRCSQASAHSNQHRLLGPPQRVSEPAELGQGWELTFPSQVTLLPLVRAPYFENHTVDSKL